MTRPKWVCKSFLLLINPTYSVRFQIFLFFRSPVQNKNGRKRARDASSYQTGPSKASYAPSGLKSPIKPKA
jgi:hypothetical protein